MNKNSLLHCKVLVTQDITTLSKVVSKVMSLTPPSALGVALYLRNTPSTAINIKDLYDESGNIESYAFLLDDQGYFYLIKTKYLKKV